jgi:hypothetical protein
MEDSKWERYAALGGFVFVVLNVVAAFLPGTPPAVDDSNKQIAKYFTDHSGAIKAGQILAGIGTIGLLWWLGSLWRMMCRAENERPRLAIVAVVSLGMSGVLAMMSGVFIAETAIYIKTIGEGAKGSYTLSIVTISAAGFFIVAFLSAWSALNWRTKMLPMWTSYLGWLAGAGFLVATGGSASGRNLFGVVGLGSFLVWCVWILAVSTFMWRGAASTTS